MRYGYISHNSGFSRHMAHTLRYFYFAPLHAFGLYGGFASRTPPSLVPVFPFPARAFHMRPHISDDTQYRNLNLLSIDYVFRPRLRLTYPEQISFTLETLDIRPEGFSPSSRYSFRHSLFLSLHCSFRYSFVGIKNAPLPMYYYIPQLRCCVSAPDIFGAEPLD